VAGWLSTSSSADPEPSEDPVTDPFVLTLSCPNRAGIVQAVSSHLGAHGCDIVEHQQFDDPVSGRLFMRTRASTGTELDVLAAGFADVAAAFGMEYAFHPRRDVRVLVMVSRSGHCLNDLIFRWRTGSLDGELVRQRKIRSFRQ